jgi:type 1 glutamine amidotransferase
LVAAPIASATGHKMRAIAFWSTTVEPDHVAFAKLALDFYAKAATKRHFVFDSTLDWTNMNEKFLKHYDVVIWLNDFPQTPSERDAFARYMDHGGGWMGFHVAGYNDKDTKWPWFVQFMGGAVFYTNNWPVESADLIVDDNTHPVTRHLPKAYRAPANEWYLWRPSPRENPDVKVLVTLNPSNYPIGVKDQITSGDDPVVWTNTKYRKVYFNMGHGDKNFDSDLQNQMFLDAISWVGGR